MKKCIKCNLEKPILEFPIRSNKRPRGECKVCSAIISKEYRKNNRSKMKLYEAKWNYGISLNEAEILYKKQNCDICGNLFKDTKTKHIDHCHLTTKVRGVLCMNCNHAIGKFKDDIFLLQKAIDYLNRGTLPIIIPMIL